MKALRYTASVPGYLLANLLAKSYPVGLLPLRLADIPEPQPPAGWEKLEVLTCGICGSDLALLYGKNSPRLSGFFSFPAVLGHEILASSQGQRVALNPNLACRERGLEPCPACSRGEENLCQNVARGRFAPGMLGFCADLPGGWSEAMVAPSHHVHPVPADVPEERAVLAEPVSVVLRGLRHLNLKKDRKVLLIGSGTLGLIAVKMLKVLGFDGEVHVLARYPVQRKLATEFGAHEVFANPEGAVQAVGAKPHKSVVGPPGLRGGYDAVIDAAGSASSLALSAWIAREGGKLVLLGSPGKIDHDFSPHWFAEVKLLGSYIYSDADFATGVELLPRLQGLEKLVTHSFSLSDWKKAIRTVIRREGIKAVFRP